jgi:hypothetical protein
MIKHANQMFETPYNHYLQIFRSLDPAETSERCAVPFDPGKSAFYIRLMGTTCEVSFPGFDACASEDEAAPCIKTIKNYEKLLLMRYLCEGRYVPRRGGQLAYDEMPNGALYLSNFRNRCVCRAARSFGSDIKSFEQAMTGFRAERLPQGDAGFRFEFVSGLYMSVILWEGDDEFAASAQFLFDDNFPAAFTAEDAAAAGEIAVDRIRWAISLLKGKE